jgi:hypothetical protein
VRAVRLYGSHSVSLIGHFPGDSMTTGQIESSQQTLPPKFGRALHAGLNSSKVFDYANFSANFFPGMAIRTRLIVGGLRCSYSGKRRRISLGIFLAVFALVAYSLLQGYDKRKYFPKRPNCQPGLSGEFSPPRIAFDRAAIVCPRSASGTIPARQRVRRPKAYASEPLNQAATNQAATNRAPLTSKEIHMSNDKLDSWLDALEEKQQKLERELAQLNAGHSALENQLKGQADPAEAQRLVQGNAGLSAHLKKQEAEADAAGRNRANASARELDEARGKQPPLAGRGRPGAVRV